jgi:hypothetical protein
VRDLRERNIRSKIRLLATGATRGGVLFGRGSLFYLLRNRFYVGEVKYKEEILPGEQPAIMDRALFDAVQQKLTQQWTTRSTTRNASDHLLTGLLFDDAGHRMVPTHAAKAGVRYRYYVSLPHLYGESKTASVGSVSRIPAIDIEDTIVNSLNERLIVQKKKPNSNITGVDDRKEILEQVARIDVHEDRLANRICDLIFGSNKISPTRNEPYPKSLTAHLHSDSVCIEGADRGRYTDFPSVKFEHFYGVSPRRYRELFERNSRKDKQGKFLEWKDGIKQPIVDLQFPFYLSLEDAVLQSTSAYLEKIKMPLNDLSNLT